MRGVIQVAAGPAGQSRLDLTVLVGGLVADDLMDVQRRAAHSGVVADPGWGGARAGACYGLGLLRGSGSGTGTAAADVSQAR